MSFFANLVTFPANFLFVYLIITIFFFENRTYKRFPHTPSTLGLFLQWMAILSLLLPKFLMIGSAMKPAPYFFIFVFLMEYGFLLIYNKLIYGVFAGQYFYCIYIYRRLLDQFINYCQ